ncbi:MAG: GNAT family N-acetyltransferase [Actinobacteria bacterium]|nr:GNAT family N-acetyltransferase [Actinomycetota bacterium]
MASDETVTIRELIGADIDEALVAAFVKLIPQLSSSAPAPTREQLQRIADLECNHLLVAFDERGTVLGSMTLVVFEIPTGIRAWIEDVVVDDAARGRGVGEALNLRALEIAYGLGAKSVDLTSRPSRQAANRLYQKIGFVARDTNVYRHQR